jgi:aspartate/methionine/tyrosine aminotransferase
MWRLNDLFESNRAHPAELLSVVAFQNLRAIRDRARKIVDADRVLLNDFLSRQMEVSAVRTEFGTTSFLRLKKGDAEQFLERLRTEYETSAVPGRFFGMSNHFRIGMGVDTEMFGEGLRRIALAFAS